MAKKKQTTKIQLDAPKFVLISIWICFDFYLEVKSKLRFVKSNGGDSYLHLFAFVADVGLRLS